MPINGEQIISKDPYQMLFKLSSPVRKEGSGEHDILLVFPFLGEVKLVLEPQVLEILSFAVSEVLKHRDVKQVALRGRDAIIVELNPSCSFTSPLRMMIYSAFKNIPQAPKPKKEQKDEVKTAETNKT